MTDLLATAALVAAVLALVPAFFTTWWLAGSDDEALNPVAPLLGIALLGTSIASVIVAAHLDAGSGGGSLAVMAAPAVLLFLAAPFAGNRAHGRAPLRESLSGVAVLSIAPLLALAAVLAG